MACFLVPAGEAIITTVAEKIVKHKENDVHVKKQESGGIKLSRKLGWLNNMLWGGSALLAFEHIWHGEVTPWFPFLTGAMTSESTAEMLHEMSTVGVGMSLTVTAVWAAMSAAASYITRKRPQEEKERAL